MRSDLFNSTRSDRANWPITSVAVESPSLSSRSPLRSFVATTSPPLPPDDPEPRSLGVESVASPASA